MREPATQLLHSKISNTIGEDLPWAFQNLINGPTQDNHQIDYGYENQLISCPVVLALILLEMIEGKQYDSILYF